MHIIHVASEFATLAKAGGLGDVTYGLSLELVRLGHQVSVILPKYNMINFQDVADLHLEKYSYTSLFEDNWYVNHVWTGNLYGVQLLFIDAYHPHQFFNRGHIYGSPDDMNRFLYFSRAVFDLLIKREMDPDVIHIHDWHSAAFAPLYKTFFPKPQGKLVLTLHNLEYQGRCSPYDLPKIGLELDRFYIPEQLQTQFTQRLRTYLREA